MCVFAENLITVQQELYKTFLCHHPCLPINPVEHRVREVSGI